MNNLHSRYRRTYSWNERNQLVLSVDANYTTSYIYSHDGERTNKYTSSGETLYFNKMWSLHTDAGNSIHGGQYAKNVYLGETRIVTKLCLKNDPRADAEELQQYYYHSDHLGSASLITDYRGDEYQRIEYTPYGEIWVEEQRVKNEALVYLPYKFTGKERDEETGLYYYGAHYLDPKYSHWMSTDPALGEYIPKAPIDDEAKKHNQNLPGMGGVFNTVNLNLYHYAGNNPVKYTDLDGREEVYFIYSYTGRKKDIFMKYFHEGERLAFLDEVKLCKEIGLSVKFISKGTKQAIKDAFSDPESRLIVISGHGYNAAAIQTHDGKMFTPNDIDNVPENLKTVILENCYQGDYKDAWKAKLGDIDFIGWSGITTTTETKLFNSKGGDCRQEHNLLYYVVKAFCEKWIINVNEQPGE